MSQTAQSAFFNKPFMVGLSTSHHKMLRCTFHDPDLWNSLPTYANEQLPTTLWYHDHVLGITRLNVYAGLAGFYLLRDAAIITGYPTQRKALQRRPSGGFPCVLAVAHMGDGSTGDPPVVSSATADLPSVGYPVDIDFAAQ
jgi:hypothetical protein